MNLSDFVHASIRGAFSDRITRAVVDSLDTDQVYVTRVGYSNPDGRSYPRLDSATGLVNGDEVLMVDLTGRGGWIVLGKIVRN